MRIRRELLELVLGIANRDHLTVSDIAHMCGTSRARAHALMQRKVEEFNSETLMDILFRLGVVVGVEVESVRAYRRLEFENPSAARRFVEPWRR